MLLDDGRRNLVDYLVHPMATEPTPAARIRAWIEGVLAQASNPRAAATGPGRSWPTRTGLSELFPDEQRESVDLLVGLLADPSGLAGSGAARRRTADVDAEAIYRLVFGLLHAHLIQRTRPSDVRPTTPSGSACAAPAWPRGRRDHGASGSGRVGTRMLCSRTTGFGCGRSGSAPGRRVRSTATTSTTC